MLYFLSFSKFGDFSFSLSFLFREEFSIALLEANFFEISRISRNSITVENALLQTPKHKYSILEPDIVNRNLYLRSEADSEFFSNRLI